MKINILNGSLEVDYQSSPTNPSAGELYLFYETIKDNQITKAVMVLDRRAIKELLWQMIDKL